MPIHRHLDDPSAPCPRSLWMGSLLDAFPGRFPTEILDEIDRLPVGMLNDVLEAKGYRQVKAMVDAADTAEARKRLPSTPLFALCQQIEMDLAQEAIDKKKAG
jgi:hypothetical protein